MTVGGLLMDRARKEERARYAPLVEAVGCYLDHHPAEDGPSAYRICHSCRRRLAAALDGLRAGEEE